MDTSIEQIYTMVGNANGKPFTFQGIVKFDDEDGYHVRTFCFLGEDEKVNDRLVSDIEFDETIFFYVSTIDEVKELMDEYNGNDFVLSSICGNGVRVINY